MGLCASKDSGAESSPKKSQTPATLNSFDDIASDTYSASPQQDQRPGRMASRKAESSRDEDRPARVSRRDEFAQLKSTTPSSSSRHTSPNTVNTRTLNNISSSEEDEEDEEDEEEEMYRRAQGGRVNSASSNRMSDVHLEEPMFGDEPRVAHEAFEEVRRSPEKKHRRMRSRQNSLLAQQKRKQRSKQQQQEKFEQDIIPSDPSSKRKSKKANGRKSSSSKSSSQDPSKKKPFGDKKKVARYNKINARLNKMRSRNKALKLTKDKQVVPPDASDDDSDY